MPRSELVEEIERLRSQVKSQAVTCRKLRQEKMDQQCQLEEKVSMLNSSTITNKVSLVEENVKMCREMEEIKEKFKRLEMERNHYRSKCICPICCEMIKDNDDKYFVALLPCGHRVCNNCEQKLNRNCPFCKSKIYTPIRLY